MAPIIGEFLTFCMCPPHHVRTQILQNSLSNTDCFELSFRNLAEVTGAIAIEGVEVADSSYFSRGGHLSWVGLVGASNGQSPQCAFF